MAMTLVLEGLVENKCCECVQGAPGDNTSSETFDLRLISKFRSRRDFKLRYYWDLLHPLPQGVLLILNCTLHRMSIV